MTAAALNLQSYILQAPPMAQIIDTSTTANTTYICVAPTGAVSSAAAWQIQRIVVSGGVTTITWADNGGFTQIADNRATSVTYA